MRSTSDSVLTALLEAYDTRTPCVLVTVVGYQGSTPRKPGAKMVVYGDGRTVGTVGGGALERFLTDRSREMVNLGQPVLLERVPMAELGMQCGGSVTVLLEPQVLPSRLYLFGAGHIAQPLAQMAALSEFDVHVIDDRVDLATPERFPTVRGITVKNPVEAIEQLAFDEDNTYVVVVTHSHALDEAIVEKVIRRPWRFLGVIGSVKKRAAFEQSLQARGVTEEQLARLRMPVGLAIGSETPAEIAVSILAQLIQVRHGETTSEAR